MLVVDTHAVVWWTLSPKLLSPRAARELADADVVGVPAIVLWEVALLARKGRLELDLPVAEWAERLLAIPRVRSLPLTATVALAAEALDMHADPADRFIVAAAREHGASLLTKDRLLRRLKVVRTIW